MNAVIHPRYGRPEVLSVEEVETPALRPDEVRLRVMASPITQGDRRLRSSDFPGLTWLPGRLMIGVLKPRHRVPGTFYAGTVVDVGADVTRFAVGDDVFGGSMHGAHADLMTVGEKSTISKMPTGCSYEEAAALPYGAGTALHFLRKLAKMTAGDRVLVLGAAGEVGRYAVQLAAHWGGRVTGVCRGADAELVKSLGAESVMDYQAESPLESGEAYDVIFDTSGVYGYGSARRALTPEGRFTTLYLTIGIVFWSLWTALFGSRRASTGVAPDTVESLAELTNLYESGAVRPSIDRRFPLTDIVSAHRHLESGDARGTVIVECNSTG